MSDESIAIKSGQDKRLLKIPWKIYVSRALSAWGDRLWSFGAGIFMVELAPENLRLVSIYGLVLSVSVIIFGAFIGDWIDKSKRLTAAKFFLAVQNLSTTLSCVLLGLYFGEVGKAYWPPWLPDIVPVITIILADIGQIASVGSKIVVEKDWIVVISMDNDDRLAKVNAVFRTIDLATLSLAPLSAGLVFDFISNSAAAYFIAAWNMTSMIFEYWLLKSIYKEFPMLAHKTIFENPESNEERKTSFLTKIVDGGKAWILYMKYPVRNAGFGLAFLYMTVLGFDNITYGFCLQQCVTESVVGALVGVSAVIGVLGSISFPFLRKKLGLTRTGLVGMFSLLITLTMSLVSIWVEGSPFQPDYFTSVANTTSNNSDYALQCSSSNSSAEFDDNEFSPTKSFWSVGLLMAGIISGRFGLWVSDLTITQLLQENVQEEHRGVIGGVQNAINSAMDTIKFVLVIVLPQTETFGWLIMASYASVCLGAIFYMTYACKHGETSFETNQPKNDLPQTTYQSTNHERDGSPSAVAV